MKKSLIYLVCFILLFTAFCGCGKPEDAPLPIQTEAPTDAPNRQSQKYTYEEYCTAYPAFAEYAAKNIELYWVVDETEEASGQKTAVIHCQNENEAYTLFQIGNAFWRYDYSEIDMSLSNFETVMVGTEAFYAFNMWRYVSTGGFYLVDLLLISPNRPDKIYSVTVENAYDAVAQKMDIKYSENAQELTVRDSKKTTILPLASKKTSTYDNGLILEKNLNFTDLYVQMSHQESEEKVYCWDYEIEDDEIYIQTVMFANYRISENTTEQHWRYQEEYEGIGEVRTQLQFDGEQFSFGDAVFTPD